MLTNYLKSTCQDEVVLTFTEIEKIINSDLPAFINNAPYRFCFNSDKNNYFKYWFNAGYYAKLEHDKRSIKFIKSHLVNTKNDDKKLSRKIEHKDSQKTYTFKKLTEDEIEEQHNLVLQYSNYGKEAELIHSILNRFKFNDNLEDIALKASVIDVTNSTQLSKYKSKISLYDISNIILNIKDFDKRVAIGDIELVNEIANLSKNKFDINLFSFASKYCCYHNYDIYGRDDYSIFDNILKENIGIFINGITKAEIEDYRTNFKYEKYNNLLGELLDANNISIQFKRRKLDHYIWYLGKKNMLK